MSTLLSDSGLATCALAIVSVLFAGGIVALAVMGRSIPAELVVPAASFFGGILALSKATGIPVVVPVVPSAPAAPAAPAVPSR